MSGVFERAEEQRLEQSFIRVLEHLIEQEKIIDSTALGITKKVIADGNLNGLSDRQRHVFDKNVAPLLNETCSICGSPISGEELESAYDNYWENNNDLLCYGCDYGKKQMEKDD